jgi:hypothetical protein
MKRVFDVAEQVVDVLAGDSQAPLLGIVQLPGESLLFSRMFRSGHHSSRYFSDRVFAIGRTHQ